MNYLFILATALVFVTTPLCSVTAAEADGIISGTILQTMDAAGYTYVELDSASGPVWVALPENTQTIGATIAVLPGILMNDFHSNTLNRTFPTILFSAGIADTPSGEQTQPAAPALPTEDPFAAAVAAERQAAPIPQQEPAASGGSMAAVAPFLEVSVDRALGDNARSVAELFAQAAELDGAVVRVRGKVVKFNANIMGRNWVHLQDGTGDPLQNTHDLVVTTTRDLAVEQIVTLQGTVAANRDFGAGYTYQVLVEEADIVE